jgi:hypothetical protein
LVGKASYYGTHQAPSKTARARRAGYTKFALLIDQGCLASSAPKNLCEAVRRLVVTGDEVERFTGRWAGVPDVTSSATTTAKVAASVAALRTKAHSLLG